MQKTILKLFIVPGAGRSRAALTAAQALVKAGGDDECELIVVDVLEEPQTAEDEKILATPTLIKKCPPPERRAVGDLSNREGLASALGL
jgi:circadian clock protein KaiB